MAHKWMKEAFKFAKEHEWEVVRQKRHIKLKHAKYGTLCCSKSPSDPYAGRQLIRDIERCEGKRPKRD